MVSSPDTTEEAKRLIRSGYCPISNKGRILSRLDRPDWLEHMAYRHTKGFPGSAEDNLAEGMDWVQCLGASAADFYRRVYGRDQIVVSEAIFRKVKEVHPSNHCGVSDYREVVT